MKDRASERYRLVAAVSSNQVGRIDLTPIALLESVFLILSPEAWLKL